MQAPIPLSLLSMFFGITGLFVCYFQNKKQNKFVWIYFVLGITLLLLGIIPGALLCLQ
jgi:uncharacterized membrane protein